MSRDIAEITRGRLSSEVRGMLTAHRIPFVKRSKNEAVKEQNVLPPIQRASDLIGRALPLPSELVEGLLYRGSTMVYGGGSKTNKTFAMMDLAVSVATGTPWWELKTTQGRVLYLDFELQEAFFRERLDKIANAKGVTVDALREIDVWNLRGHAADLSTIVEQIIERIKETPYSLIIIDPIYKVMGDRDENSAGDINSLMNELDKMAVASGASIVVGHHFSKGNQAGKESMDRISGSGVFGRSPDAIVIITKHEQENIYTVETTLRNHKALEPFCVEWSYPLMMRSPEYNPAKLKLAGLKKEQYPAEQLLIHLGPGPLTTSEWQKVTCKTDGMSERTFATKKKILVDQKRVVQENEFWRMALIQKPITKETQLQGATSAIAPVPA
jgi:AAA domain-containing protein